MKAKQFLAALLAAGMLLAAGCGKDEGEPAPEDEVTGTAVETMTVVSGDIANQSRLSGKVIAARDVSIFPPVPAKVLSVSVQVGDTVNEGQTLFTLDKKDIQKQYQPLLDNYNRSKTLFDEQIRQAQKNVSDTEALLNIGAASQAQLDQAKLTLLQTQTNAQSSLSQLDESMKDVRTTLEDTNVKATMTGVVTAVSVVAGGTASQQSPAVVISESQKPQVLVSVSESVQPYLKTGDSAICAIESIGRSDVVAKISTVAPASNQQTQLYEVRLDLPAGIDVQIGMFVDVTFQTDHKQGVVVVPTESVLTDGETEYCFVVEDGKAKRVIVTTGLTAGETTEVTGGLSEGETLVVVGQQYLSDGAEVRIVQSESTGEE
ncbi:efflux RND transporter periplasmic adaptor subunit [Agathobaculum sp.]|uniref:efflux RND transporter periplasmic adaptor subunit n=1 Tax=Agathobaculum sp. TaxID=2048138 RepID=UPI002A7F2EC1|nr:efflux RND transporter periplasmic adaptor subunit [Agathobaculum sp.]MCI5704023.1 efflux RND transporter periplasmic adaptor subunit [Pseudoflavonifractor sp.]MDY3618917.1 efflux RND transporter periplasmic adaptor subunit [Agathobaculum sp.]